MDVVLQLLNVLTEPACNSDSAQYGIPCVRVARRCSSFDHAIHTVSQATIPNEAEVLRQEMGRPLKVLRFSAALEDEFTQELRAQQRRSALFTLGFLGVVWVFFVAFDWWRLHTIWGSGKELQFILGVMVQRWVVLACFLCTLYVLLQPKTSFRTHTAWVMASVISCGCGVVISSYTCKNLEVPEASIVMLLTVVVALYPLGIRLRQAMVAAVVVCIFSTLAGPWLLQPAYLAEHWMVACMLWVTLVLSGVTAFFREKALRQQFLLRKLLDWEACHDPLTGLANRRMFREQFQRNMLHARREKEALFLALIDIDHFKLYNDLYGHQAGDEVLRLIGQLLADYARRPLDLAVRLGGEEFAMVAYDEDVQSLRKRMEQLLIDLHGLNLAHDASPTAPYVTVSIGLAQVRNEDTVDSVFRMADSLLYQAKEQGRNQVCGVAAIALPVINPRRPSWAQQASAVGPAS